MGRVAPVDPLCGTCSELTVMHKGDRLNLAVVPCSCKQVRATDLGEDKLNRRSKATFGTEPPGTGTGTGETRLRWKFLGCRDEGEPWNRCGGVIVTGDAWGRWR